MKRLLLVPCLMVLVGVAFSAEHGGKAKEAKFTGEVKAKPADAAANVAGLLSVAGGKKAAAKEYKLLADADSQIAKDIAALVGKQATVTGEDTGDGIKVAKIEEKAAGGKKPAKGKAGGEGGGEAHD
jgi:hypothetical protein